jgi:uncharacterized membrane protein HdeD (DUF308 family)
MSLPDPVEEAFNELSMNAKNLTRQAVNGIRVAFGIAGVVAIILGILLLVWPAKTIGVVAVFAGIYFIVVGIVRLAVGIFSRGISGGLRTLDIILGILLVIAGIIALRNIAVAAAALLILVVAIIGIGWIIEGVMVLVESSGAPSRGLAITHGILSIVAGIIVLVIPRWSVVWLVIITGILLIVLGAFAVYRAFTFGREVLRKDAPKAAPEA